MTKIDRNLHYFNTLDNIDNHSNPFQNPISIPKSIEENFKISRRKSNWKECLKNKTIVRKYQVQQSMVSFFNVFSVPLSVSFFTLLALINKLREKSRDNNLMINVAEDLEKLKLESEEKSIKIAVLEAKAQKLDDEVKSKNATILALQEDLATVKTEKQDLDDIIQKLIRAYKDLGKTDKADNGSNASGSKKKRKN